MKDLTSYLAASTPGAGANGTKTWASTTNLRLPNYDSEVIESQDAKRPAPWPARGLVSMPATTALTYFYFLLETCRVNLLYFILRRVMETRRLWVEDRFSFLAVHATGVNADHVVCLSGRLSFRQMTGADFPK